jgi:hypothetical protein
MPSNYESKKGWWHDSSGRALAQQAQSLEFNPQYCFPSKNCESVKGLIHWQSQHPHDTNFMIL